MTEEDLPNEINQFYDALLSRVALIKKQTRARILEIKKEQCELAANLREKLAKGESLRKADFDQMLASLITKRKKRQQEVMALLERFQKEEKEMAEGLKELLADGKKVRIRQFKKFLAEFKEKAEERKGDISETVKAAEKIKNEAKEIIERFREEREEMSKEWQKLAATMQKKRKGKLT